MKKVYQAVPKNYRSHIISICILLGLFHSSSLFAQTTVTFPSTTTWTCPVGVNSIIVECWGGGGSGGGATGSPAAGGGGGGGSYVKNTTVAVTPGTIYTVTVGAGGTGTTGAGSVGNDTWFNNTTTILAKGGNGGALAAANNQTAAGAPVVTTGNVGATAPFSYYGGAGGTGGAGGASGGGGGSSAGTGSNGNGATGVTGGTAPSGGFAGVSGSTSSADGTDNAGIGGGGAGAHAGSNTDRSGGNGAAGQVKITYTQLTYKSSIISVSAASTAPWCAGETRNVQVTIKNTGTATWTDASPDINIGVKWNLNGANWTDYYVRVDAAGLVPNATQTYTLPVTASNNIGAGYTTPLAAGTNNLIFDVVYESISWFGDNAGGVGPGNSKFTTPAITINAIPGSPTGTAAQTFCAANNPTVANLAATGTTIKWYVASSGGTALVTTTPLVNGTHYFASQTNASGCEGTSRFDVTATVSNPAAPTGTAAQTFCAISNPTVANLAATGSGIKWYAAASGGTALVATTPLVGGTHYFASQTISGCEGSTRFDVTVTLGNPAAPTGTAAQTFCAINNPTVANLTATGTAIKWYSAASGGAALVATTPLVNGTDYFASQTVAGCEGISRFDVTATVNNPAAPTGTASQIFCAINIPTVANLTATGSSIQWYAAATGGTALAGTTAIINGTHYFASQTVSGCEGISRFDVTVTVSDPAVPTGAASQSFCSSASPTVSNLSATGTAILWYTVPTGGTALLTTTPLVNGTHYYASQTISGCEGTARFDVTAVVNTEVLITGQPGPTPQIICASFPVTFTVTATGDVAGYQWYLGSTPLADNTNISGSQTASLKLDQVTPSDAGFYHVVLTGTAPCANVVSSDAELQVNQNIIISSQPAPQTVCTGNTATFNVATSTGTGLTYQWRKGAANLADGGNISGATTASLSIANIAGGDAGNYNVVISDGSAGCPNIISSNALLTVSATSIGGTVNTSATKCSGTNSGTLTLTGKTGTVQNWESSTDGGTTWTPIANTLSSQTYTNLTQTTWYRAVVASGVCPSDNSIPAIITINPVPDAVATPASQTICSGTSISNIILTGSVPGTTFNWTRDNPAVTGIATGGNGDISGALTNATAAPITVTFTITPTANTCLGTPIIATVLVNPTPVAVASPASQTKCSGIAITTIALTSTTTGTTFTWTRDNTASVTGITAGGSGNISGTLVNTTSAPVTVTFTIIPSANGCDGAPKTATVLVNPTPDVTATPSSQAICSATPMTAIALTSSTTGTTFTWTRDNTAGVTGLAASGSGSSISGTLTNTTAAPVTVTFTIIPTASTCGGTPITATVLVNPSPNTIRTPASQTICSAGTITTIALTSTTTGTTYTWTRDNNATVTGIASTSSGDISGNLTNTTAAPVTVTFTITPSANSCPGATSTATVLVNPTPNAVATPSSQTKCSGSAITTIVLSGSTTGTTYAWTRDNSASVTGIAASGSGNIAGTFTNTTSAPITVTFTITPSANGCPGTPITASVLVNPTANSIATPSGQTICSAGTITTIALTGTTSGTTFAWTRNNTATVTGMTASGSGDINGSLTNTTAAPVTVTFTITPSANGCTGTPTTATVLVNPTPNAVATPSSQTKCSGAAITTIALTSSTTGTTYTWTRDNNASVTGIAASGSGNISGPLTNTTFAPVTVTFTITPSANGCAGNPITATVIVNPVANAVATPSSQTTCSGTAITTIALTTGTTGATYTWTRDNTAGATGIAASGSGNISGTLTNTTASPITVTFTITPSFSGCSGTPTTATVLVNPSPVTTRTPSSQTICSAGTITTIALTSTTTGTTFTWTRNNTASVTGITASGSGDISGSLTNTTVAPVTVTFTITPAANGCNGTTSTATVLVNPTPNAVATPASQIKCSISPITTIVLSGSTTGTTYAWARDNTASVTGIAANGSGNISGTLTNTTAAPITVTFTIIPSANSCPGSPITATVLVNPKPVAGAITGTATTVCIGSTIALTSNATGIAPFTYNWSSSNGAVVSVNNSGIVTGVGAGTANITYTVSDANGCSSTSANYLVTVTKPAANAITQASGISTICVASTVALTSNATGTGTLTYTWASSNASIATVSTTGVVTGVAAGTANITYTVTDGNGCQATSPAYAILVNPIPTGSISVIETSGTTNNDGIICTGSSVTFSATAGYGSYIFKVNGTAVQSGTTNTYNTSALNNGDVITVDVANGFNCGATFAPVTINVNTLPVPTIIAAENSGTPNNNVICAGDNVTFTAGGGIAYNFKVNGSSVQSGTSNTYSTTTLTNGASVTVNVTNGNGCTATSAAQVINVNTLPSGTLSASATTICAGGSITFTATAGFANYNFKINNVSVQSTSSNTFTSTTLANGNIVTVDVTNAGGCIATFTPAKVITVNALPVVSMDVTENSGVINDNNICSGSSVTFTATPGFSNYKFYLNGAGAPLQNGSSNIYSGTTLVNGDFISVVVTNAGSCSSTFTSAPIMVVASPLGTLSASPASICAGDNVVLTATPGFANYSFQVNGSTVQNGSSNIYSSVALADGDVISVDVTNSNTCLKTFNAITLTVHPLPTGTLVAVENSGNIANDGIICDGDAVVFTAPTGFANYDFILNGATVQSSASNTYTNNSLSNGDNVTVALANSNGCVGLSNAITITVNLLPVMAPITGNMNICLNSTTTLSNVTTGGVWSSLNTAVATIDAAGLVSGIAAGTATINYTFTNSNGCSATATTTITVNAPPTVAAIGGNFNLCVGGTSTLTDATAGGTWSSNNTAIATINSSGLVTGISAGTATISYLFTDANGCSTTVTADVTINAVPFVAAISGATSVCENNSTSLSDATSGGVWGSSNTAVATISVSGVVTGISAGTTTITYSVTDACSQLITSSLTFTVNPKPSVVITNPLAICSPSTADLTTSAITAGSTSGLTFTYWKNAAATIAYATPATAVSGTYYIKGTTASGCFDIQPVTITVNPSPTIVIHNPSAVCSPSTVDLTLATVTAGSTSGLTYSYWTDAAASISYPTPASAGAGTYYIKGTTAAGCFDIKAVTVTVNPVPTVTPHNPAAVCFPSTVDITLPAVTAGSTSGLTYTYWTNAGATIMFITPTTAGAGTYYIKGTTASGCSDIQPVTVTVTPSPTVVITNPAAVCSPSTVNITAAAVTSGSTAGLTLSYWTNAAATVSYATPSTATTGTYYIKGATVSGCFDIKPVTVTVNPLPTATISGTTSVCQNSASPNITFTGASGTAPYIFTYKINAGGNLTVTSTGNVATVTAPTAALGTFTYTLISVKDASSTACTQNQSGTATITISGSTPIVAASSSPTAICLGSSTNLFIPSGTLSLMSENFEGTSTFTEAHIAPHTAGSEWLQKNSPFTYRFTTTFNSGSPKYMLSISDNQSTSNSPTNTSLTSPVISTLGYTSLNFQYRTYYRAAPAAGDVAVIEVSTNGGASWTVVQDLTLSGTIGAAASFSTQNFNLNSYVNKATLQIRFRYTTNNGWYWAVDDINLTGTTTSAGTYSWSAVPSATAGLPAGAGTPSPANANIVATPTVAGSTLYTVTLTNLSGCTSTKDVPVTVNPVPVVTITADYCAVAGKVKLTANASPGSTYVWSTGETTQSINVDVAGDYDVTASFGTGCTATATIAVAQELVINGDFESGNTGFTSQYAINPQKFYNGTATSGLWPEGDYAVDKSAYSGYNDFASHLPAGYHPSFHGRDHTTGSGNFMMINGAPALRTIWEQTVAVRPNTNYYFSAWAMNLNPASPARLQFEVNGVLVGTIADLSLAAKPTSESDVNVTNWQRFYSIPTWTSGPTTTTAVIRIVNLNIVTGGNDFGLDDISFGTLSTFVQLESAPGTDAQTPCVNTPVTPIVYSVGSTASGPTVTGLPPGMSTSFNGVLFTITGTPTVAGNYTYTVTTTGSCNPSTATGTINVQTQTIGLTSGSAAPVCINTTLPALVYTTGGTATGASITSGALPAGVTGFYDVPTRTFNITGTPTVTGIFNYTITTSGTCTPASISGTITVQSQTITLNSANNTQTICINSPISNIQYTIGGTAINASVTGLPAGLSGSYGGGVFIISGTATASGTFNYTVTTSGTCTGITATGTINVTPAASLTLTSGAGTNPQTACKGNVITNITYAVNDGTGASVTGLPAGVSGSYNNGTGVFTISGAPTAIAGIYNYTITTSGGCGVGSVTGVLTVQAQTISLTGGSVSPSLCANTLMTDIVYTIGGTAASAGASGLPSGITGTLSGSVFTISGTPTAAAGAYPYAVTTSGSCGQVTASGTITITAAPVGGTLTSLLVCSGSSGNVTLTGQSGNIVRWEMSTDGGTTWNVLTNTTITQSYTNLTQPTMYRVAVTRGGCNTVYSNVATLNIHNLWTGATSTDWNIASNWSGNVLPSMSCPDVYIPAGTPNQPVLGYGTATINNIHILPGANLVVNGSGTLQVAGLISNAGIFNASNGAIEFNGTSPQTIALNTFMNNAVHDLVISNSTATGVILAGPLDVYRSVNYGAAGKNLNTGGFLTLKSTATETAWLGNMTGHTIVGDVTVERYIATGTGAAPNHGKSWQMLAIPTTGQTIKNAWQEGATATNVSSPAAGSAGNPKAGFGTMLTSDVANAATQPSPGFDALTATGASIKVYNYVSDTYTSVTNTQAPIYNQKGYFTFIRGDRSVFSAFAAAVPTVLRTKGTLFTPANLPPVTTVVAGKFESIGNPYASAIDKRNIIKTGGVDEFFYVWDPRLGGVNNYGAFQTFSKMGTDYVVTPGGGSYGSPGSINNYIQSGQAFLVQATGSNGTVSFNENSKANGSSLITLQNPMPLVQRILRTSLITVNTDGSTAIIDGTLNSFDDEYSNAIDQMDAKKSFNTGENLSVRTGGKLLVIERRNMLTQKDTIFLNLTGIRVQSYQFRFDAENVATGLVGFLEDNYLHTRTPLSLNGSTVVNFSIVNVPGSYANDRFRIVFEPAVVLPVTFTSVKAYRQDKNINVEWKVENEMNIKQYEVEKSVNGTGFTTLVIKAATANGGHSASYAGMDVNPAEGYNYYRVKSVDLNGKTEYTNVVKVQMGSIKQDITIYPNPITDGMIHLQLMNQPEGKYDIRLLNKLGQVILSKQINHAEGNSTELIKWDFNLAHGMYQLEVVRPGGSNKVISVMY